MTDSEMLDWMERVKPVTFCPSGPDDDWYLYPEAIEPTKNVEVAYQGSTLREAIRKAMQNEQSEESTTLSGSGHESDLES